MLIVNEDIYSLFSKDLDYGEQCYFRSDVSDALDVLKWVIEKNSLLNEIKQSPVDGEIDRKKLARAIKSNYFLFIDNSISRVKGARLDIIIECAITIYYGGGSDEI